MTIAMTLLIVLLLQAGAWSETVGDIIPDVTQWGISRDDFANGISGELTACEINKKKALKQTGLTVDEYPMEAYYVFGEKMWDSNGWTYSGLNKIVYVLSDAEQYSSNDLQNCRETLSANMAEKIGEPDETSKAVTTWNKGSYKIEIGKGKFEKYTGSKKTNVAIVFTAIDIPKPSPTPTATPKPTPTPTPAPVIKQNWSHKYLVDEFNLPTDVDYYEIQGTGTFSNSATTNSRLTASVQYCPAYGMITFDLWEYNSSHATALIDTEYKVTFMDSKGKKYTGTGIMYSNTDMLAIFDDSAVYRAMVNAFMEGGTLRFSFIEKDRTFHNYVFVAEDIGPLMDYESRNDTV